MISVRSNLKEFNLQLESDSVVEALIDEVKQCLPEEEDEDPTCDEKKNSEKQEKNEFRAEEEKERQEQIDVTFQVNKHDL